MLFIVDIDVVAVAVAVVGDTEIERRVSEMDNPIEEKTAFLSEFNLVAKAGQFHLVERSKANADSVEISHFSAVL